MRGLNPAVVAVVPECAKHINGAIYLMALHSRTTAQAIRHLRKIEDELPVPIVEPWIEGKSGGKFPPISFLSTTGYYSKGHTDPDTFDHRDTESSRITPEFSPGAEKPKPRRRRKRLPRYKYERVDIARMVDGVYERLDPPAKSGSDLPGTRRSYERKKNRCSGI